MYDLGAFGLSDMVRLDVALRRVAEAADSMEDAAQAMVAHLADGFLEKETGRRAFVLARLFVTRPLGALEPGLRARVRDDLARVGGRTDDDVRCLTLLASAGAEEAWNSRTSARHHGVIPLVGEGAVRALPMVAEMLAQLGVDVERVVHSGDGAPGDLLVPGGSGRFGVFLVPEALGDPHVPDQAGFVVPYGVRSVLGFGGGLPDGEMFAVVLFTRAPVPQETAERFRTVASSAGLGLLPHARGRIFRTDPEWRAVTDPEVVAWRAQALAELLDVHERTVLDQSAHLEDALVALEDRAEELARSHDAVRQQEALRAATLASALDAVVSIDGSGRVLEWNPAAERFFGHTRAEALGRVMVDFLVPHHLREGHRVGFARYLASGEGPIIDQRFLTEARHADGTTVPIELTVTRLDHAGPSQDQPVFTAFLRDMTDARRADEERFALLESEREARAAAEASADRLARLQSVAAELAQAHTAHQVADAVLTVGLAQTEGSSGGLWGLDPEGPTLYVLHTVGSGIGLASRSPLALGADLPVAEAVRLSAPVWVPSPLVRDARYPDMAGADSSAQSFAVLPLESGDRALGALVLGFAEPRPFSDDERRFLRALAAQAAQALDRARLRDLERESAGRLAFLAEAGRILGSSLDYRATLQQVTELALSMLGEVCVVDLVEADGEVRRVAVAHADEERTRLLQGPDVPPDPQPLLARVLRTGTTAVIEHAAGAGLHGARPGPGGEEGSAPPLGPVMVVPLLLQGQTVGALSLAGTVGSPPYDESDVALAEELAQRAAVAIDNARAHEERTEAALTLQRSLLPESLPATPGLELAVRYLPGTVGTEVGGDWFDVIPLSPTRYAIVMGDVMGRGVRAAAVMGQIRAAVRAYASLELSPEVLLSHLDALVGSLEGGQIVTCTYAVYDVEAGSARFATAGHVPPVVVVGGESWALDLPPGVPLGVGGVGGPGFSTTEVRLPPGATLALYTDGLVENRDRDLDKGVTALRDALGEASRDVGLLEDLTDHVLARMGRAEGHEDDVALLVARPAHPPS